MHFTTESFSPVAADEVTESMDPAEEDELSSVRSLLFEDSEEYELWSSSNSEEDEPDPRVQEQVGSRYDEVSNSTEICDFLI